MKQISAADYAANAGGRSIVPPNHDLRAAIIAELAEDLYGARGTYQACLCELAANPERPDDEIAAKVAADIPLCERL